MDSEENSSASFIPEHLQKILNVLWNRLPSELVLRTDLDAFKEGVCQIKHRYNRMEPDRVNSPSPSSSDDPEEKIVKPSNKCEVCGKVFMTKALLKRHLQSHTGEKPHVCKICGNQYTQSWSLKTHMAKHTGDMGKQKPTESHACGKCGKTFGSTSLVKRHMISHTGEKKHVCQICGNRYTQSWSLKTHMVKHNGDQTGPKTHYSCSVCGKPYESLWLVNRHMNSHNREKKNACHICGRSYVQAWSLKTHLLSHEGSPEVHKCSTCGKEFGSVSLVNRHMASHSGAKPHICFVCGSRFTQAWSLKTHIVNKHAMRMSGGVIVEVDKSLFTAEEDMDEASSSDKSTGKETNSVYMTPVLLLDGKPTPSGVIHEHMSAATAIEPSNIARGANEIKEESDHNYTYTIEETVKEEVIDSGDDSDDFVCA